MGIRLGHLTLLIMYSFFKFLFFNKLSSFCFYNIQHFLRKTSFNFEIWESSGQGQTITLTYVTFDFNKSISRTLQLTVRPKAAIVPKKLKKNHFFPSVTNSYVGVRPRSTQGHYLNNLGGTYTMLPSFKVMGLLVRLPNEGFGCNPKK